MYLSDFKFDTSLLYLSKINILTIHIVIILSHSNSTFQDPFNGIPNINSRKEIAVSQLSACHFLPDFGMKTGLA